MRVPYLNGGHNMGFEIISGEGHADYEIWTCDVKGCGCTLILQGVGGDVAECPRCLYNEHKNIE